MPVTLEDGRERRRTWLGRAMGAVGEAILVLAAIVVPACGAGTAAVTLT